MRKVITGKDVETLLAQGKGLDSIPANALLTPTARDAIRAWQNTDGRSQTPTYMQMAAPVPVATPAPVASPAPAPVVAAAPAPAKAVPSVPPTPVVPDYEYKWRPGSDPKTPEAIQAFFNSPEIQVLKERMCDIGRRMWSKNYTDGNGGNITIRVGDNLVLCTPTLISKGFINPEDICLVDLDGNQKAGWRKRTSEVNTHLAIMKAVPEAKSCLHAHPVYGTAFAVAGIKPPTCLIPEPEIFLGEIGLARYETPGTPENARAVGEVAKDHQSIIMQNHGVICWGKDVEDVYWKMENTEAYCQTVYIASQLGNGLNTYGASKLKELISIRRQLGMSDKREGLKECELCDNSEFRPGVVCVAGQASAPAAKEASVDESVVEALIGKVTDQIMARLK